MNLWEKYKISFQGHATKTAFCIGNRLYTYIDFEASIAGCQQLLQENLTDPSGQPVGVMCNDSLETFAAIFATWFSGAHFVPLHPQHPELVNEEKIRQSGMSIILDSNPETRYVCTYGITGKNPLAVSGNTGLAYILFTSGSTGKPKGVPISETNLNAFVEGFLELYPDLNSSDRFLQTYDLTSDAAFTGYLIPLLLGATVYTIPSGGFKYLNIVKYLQQYEITWTQYTPSVLNYLRPYFKSIQCNSLKHSHFGGEALPLDLVAEWASCVPNAEISNIYGPTETTITCSIHRTGIPDLPEKVYNGIISIGKPIGEVKILILGKNGMTAQSGEKGELCIGGKQVMSDYLTNPGNNLNPFYMDENGERYYRSGDLVFQDTDGYLFYCGRIDDQLKINGYRIEPAEIELAVSRASGGSKSKAFEFRNKTGTESIVVFIENTVLNPDFLKEQLRAFLPASVLPEKIIPIRNFPLNSNGKADKNALFNEYSSLIYE
ncbi:MAG: AMP-binding protein [Prolixibacteraceae bacterium]